MVTVKELKDQARTHNQKQCIRLSQRKSALQAALAAASGSSSAPAPAPQNQKKKTKKKKRIVPTLISTSAGTLAANAPNGRAKCAANHHCLTPEGNLG